MVIEYIEMFFLDEQTNELNIVTDEAKVPEYHLYWTYDRSVHTVAKTEILVGDQKNMQFDFAYDQERRQYFMLEFTTGEKFLFGHRILPIAGMYNFRDMGGYLTTSGQRVKWGVGYRSDYLYNLADRGIPYLESLGLKTIIDFRSPEEVADRPNKDIGVRNFVFDPQAYTAQLAGSLQSGSDEDHEEIMAKAENEAAGDEEMIIQQESFVDSEPANIAFGNMLHTIAQKDDVPVMFHCRGGKDRTGFAAMLFLGILGVDETMLIHDYMLTHRARKKKNEAYYQHFLQTTGDVDKAKYMYALFDTKPKYIMAAIAKIKKEYGTIKAYAQKVLHVSDEEILKLETLFLE